MESELNKNRRPFTRFIIIASLVMVPATILLVIALTNVMPGNPLHEYRLIVVMGYIAVGGFVREAWKRQQK